MSSLSLFCKTCGVGKGKGHDGGHCGNQAEPLPLLLGNPGPAFLGPVSSETTQYPALEAAAQRRTSHLSCFYLSPR